MSMGYGLTFGLAIVSLPLLGNAIQGLSLLRHGGDPLDALDGVGLICFVAMFGLGFLLRLVLWRRASDPVRYAARTFLTVILCLFLIATGYAIIRAWAQRDVPGWLEGCVVLATLCQIATLSWVFHYRREV